MSYESRLEAAIAVIKQHNMAMGSMVDPLSPEATIAHIKALGATSEERLAQLRWEDILECFQPAPKVKPILLAKSLADIFRSGGKFEPKEATGVPVSAKKAGKMTPAELIAVFDPEDPDGPVGKRLKEISRNEPFLVYSSGRLVDTETSLKLLLEVKRGFEGRKDIDLPGRGVVKVYRIGELPENYAEENPLYRNRPLRPDGTCDQTGRSWEGVPLNVRQLLRIAMDTGELKVTHEKAHDLLDMIMENVATASTRLRSRYRGASVQFDELAQTGSLPSLKIPLKPAKQEGGGKGKGPFAGGRKVDPRPLVPVPLPPSRHDQERFRRTRCWFVPNTSWTKGYYSSDGGNTWTTGKNE